MKEFSSIGYLVQVFVVSTEPTRFRSQIFHRIRDLPGPTTVSINITCDVLVTLLEHRLAMNPLTNLRKAQFFGLFGCFRICLENRSLRTGSLIVIVRIWARSVRLALLTLLSLLAISRLNSIPHHAQVVHVL